ncbi:DUF6776 family protein [Aliikangiella sp. G2MR2-5]|uniref:DUF6776 family protein n=1 Tax=Aliikangiella sp. G2MR2-5 TaxID=2788943 RepID=UPI0018AA2833|nr:DUF6776 family protein [Aliikangiella sp. G2MR2-5]
MVGPELVIRERKSFAWYLGVFIFAALLIFGSFYFGRFLAIKERQEMLEKTAWLEQKVEEYQLAYQEANQALVMQTQSAQVDLQSTQQLMETVKQLQETQKDLEEELKFYRKIMAPEKDQQGLTIAEFALTPGQSSRNAQFKLVLTQAGKQEQYLKGGVSLVVKGQEKGAPKEYPFRELGAFQAKDFEFQFRYFQNMEGEIALPEGFIAEQVLIKARTRGLGKNQSAEKQFAWKI